jgi:hypothetical protein
MLRSSVRILEINSQHVWVYPILDRLMYFNFFAFSKLRNSESQNIVPNQLDYRPVNANPASYVLSLRNHERNRPSRNIKVKFEEMKGLFDFRNYENLNASQIEDYFTTFSHFADTLRKKRERFECYEC